MTNDTMTYDEALRRLEELVSQLNEVERTSTKRWPCLRRAPPCSSDAKRTR